MFGVVVEDSSRSSTTAGRFVEPRLDRRLRFGGGATGTSSPPLVCASSASLRRSPSLRIIALRASARSPPATVLFRPNLP